MSLFAATEQQQPLLPQVQSAYQNDPRRSLVAAMLAQGQQGLQSPIYNPGSALARAFSAVVPGIAGTLLNKQYQQENATALKGIQDTIGSLNAPPSGGPTNVNAAMLPQGYSQITDLASKLAQNPATASQGLDLAMKGAEMGAQSRSALAQELMKQDMYIDPNTNQLAPLPGASAAKQALAAAQSGGTAQGSYQYDIGKALASQGLNVGPNGVTQIPGFAGATAGIKGAQAGAEKGAQNASDLAYKPAIAGATAAAEAPFQTVEARPGGAIVPKTSIIGTPIQPAVPGPQGPSPVVPGSAPATSVQPSIPNQAPQGATPGAAGIRQLPGGGIQVPNPTIFEPQIHADTEETAKDRETAIKSQQDLGTVKAIQDFLPQVKTGWSAETKLEGARILRAAGVPDDAITGMLQIDPANAQALQKKFVELSAGAARNMGAREPGSVIQMFAKAYPNLGLEPETIGMQTNAIGMNALRNQRLADEKTNYLNQSTNDLQTSGQYRGLQGFNEQFNAAHPAENYMHAAEAMSGPKFAPWKTITDPAKQQSIIDLMPSGTQFLAPDGQMRIKP